MLTIQTLNEIKNRGKKNKRKKKIVQKRPRSVKNLERDYLKEILPMIAFANELVKKMLLPVVEKAVARVLEQKKRDSAIRQDDWIDDVDGELESLRRLFYTRYSDEKILDIARGQAQKINKQNKAEWNKAVEKVYNIPAISLDDWQAEAMKAFVKDNVKYIKSIPEKGFTQVENIVMREVQSGTLTKDIASKIQERFKVLPSDAARIARDQTNKFNGNLTELRQTSLGIKKYIWSTIIDGRERPEHRENNNKEFEWAYPPPTGHPGDDILCRCTALAVFDE